jgi:hypothetical protein
MTWTTSAVKMRLLASSHTGFTSTSTRMAAWTLFESSIAGGEGRGRRGARKVDGVKSVATSSDRPPAKQEAVAENDGAIDVAISKRLEANQRLKGSAIKVDVKNGIAHLTGSVETQSDRITALTVTRATSGVRGLVDDLKIAVPSVSSK